MSAAIKSIVDGYVSLKNRTALEELRAHRQRLRKHLDDQPRGWVDLKKSKQLFDDDIQAIEDGLSRL